MLLASSLDTFLYPCYEKRNSQREAKRKGMEEITIETTLGIPSSCDGDSGLGRIRRVKKFEKDYGSNWVKTSCICKFELCATKHAAHFRITVLAILLLVENVLENIDTPEHASKRNYSLFSGTRFKAN